MYVCAVRKVVENGVHILDICDSDRQVSQRGEWVVFILVLKQREINLHLFIPAFSSLFQRWIS